MRTACAARRRAVPTLALALFGLVLAVSPALAHSTHGAIILLLPTGYYLIGGAVAVAASFALLAFIPADWLQRLSQREIPLVTLPRIPPAVTSMISFLLMLGLLAAGIYGSRDPLSNPLPLFVWTVGWVAFALSQAVVGSLMPLFNPWSGPLALLRLIARRPIGVKPLLRYPPALGYLPAMALLLAFAWFELVDIAPNDPFRMAVVVGAYWLGALVGMILFGEAQWTGRAEPFSIFFGLIGGMSPLMRRAVDDGRRIAFALSWPGRALLDRPGLPPSGVLFVLLTIAYVPYDGFSRTFFWLDRIGVNPLEFPGRSAVQVENTIGLVAAFAVIVAVFFAALAVGRRFFSPEYGLWALAGRLAVSVLPISVAFHASHYLTNLLIGGQYALVAATDPFHRHWGLLDLGHFHVTTSFLNTFEDVTMIWNAQTVIICLGHIVGIIMAHVVAQRLTPTGRAASLSQLGLAVLMVAYTIFGLWLLSTPSLG